MLKNSQCIIICGGYSISKGIPKGLWEKIKDKFVIGTNFSFKFFNSTVTSFVDSNPFYERYLEDLKSVPLLIGLNKKGMETSTSNLILLEQSKIHNCNIAGIFSISLAIKLLGDGELFILGLDNGLYPVAENDTRDKININGHFYLAQDVTNKEISRHCKNFIVQQGNKKLLLYTHFYQDEFTHKGTGKYEFYYEKKRTDRWYKSFKEQSKVKIYNINDNPLMVTSFPKISYNKFFELLNDEIFDQNILREEIREELVRGVK